jgi:uncharacterized protein YbaP (TraB family)
MNFTRRSMILAVAGAAAACASATPSSADTYPFWSIAKGRAKVFLIGDCGSPANPWTSPRIEAALAQSAVFWKETPDMRPEDVEKFTARGASPDRPLSSRLTAPQKQKVEAACASVGAPFASVEPLKPWLVAASLNSAAAGRQGAQASPLPVLNKTALAAGKPVRTEFPTTDSLVDWFDAIPEQAQVEYLLATAEIIGDSPEAWPHRQAVWATGDLSVETRRIEEQMRRYPAAFEAETASRNRDWLPRIGAMLDSGETSFILVGASHLVGRQGMLALLKEAGLPPKRI